MTGLAAQLLILLAVACTAAAIGWLSRLGYDLRPAPRRLPRRIPGAALLPVAPQPSPQLSILDLRSNIDWLGPYPGRPEPRGDPAPRRAKHGATVGYWDTPTELHRLVGPLETDGSVR